MGWRANDIPSQSGRLAVVTGTGGLGFEAALALARAGAEVVLAGRDPAKGDQAVAAMLAGAPPGSARFEPLDLASLASVEAFADGLIAESRPIDILIANAGVMALPGRRESLDGFELQFATNYLGHFALVGRLLPRLIQARAARVVTVSSLYHRAGRIAFDDPQAERGYSPYRAYGQSKLAMLMFALELDRRARAAGLDLRVSAAHPGYARTALIANGPGESGPLQAMNRAIQPWMSQSAAAGALPLLYAATAPEAVGGGYYGPGGLFELTGSPLPAHVAMQARDEAAAGRLWTMSEQLTGVTAEMPHQT